MKKALGFLKSNIMIFIGALLFLLFLNYLAVPGATMAIGIIATLISLYYIAIGVLGIIMGDKLNALTRKIFDVIAVCLFAMFMFVTFILAFVGMIQTATNQNSSIIIGPTAWFIGIFGMLVSLALMGFYPFARFFKNEGLKKLGYLFAALFALGLLLEALFDVQGFAITLGDVPFVLFALEIIFVIYLFDSFAEAKEEPKAIPQKAQPKEEKAEEPAPEEAPEESEAEPEEPKEE